MAISKDYTIYCVLWHFLLLTNFVFIPILEKVLLSLT
jgi:hypothetical protein